MRRVSVRPRWSNDGLHPQQPDRGHGDGQRGRAQLGLGRERGRHGHFLRSDVHSRENLIVKGSLIQYPKKPGGNASKLTAGAAGAAAAAAAAAEQPSCVCGAKKRRHFYLLDSNVYLYPLRDLSSAAPHTPMESGVCTDRWPVWDTGDCVLR